MAKPLIIGGSHRAAAQAILNINPSDTGDVIGEFASAEASDMLDAIAAAVEAAQAWAAATPLFRANILQRAGQMIDDRSEELGRLLSPASVQERGPRGAGTLYELEDLLHQLRLKQSGDGSQSASSHAPRNATAFSVSDGPR